MSALSFITKQTDYRHLGLLLPAAIDLLMLLNTTKIPFPLTQQSKQLIHFSIPLSPLIKAISVPKEHIMISLYGNYACHTHMILLLPVFFTCWKDYLF